MTDSHAESEQDSKPEPTGRTIVDPNTGETLTFVETAAEGSDDQVVMLLELAPGTLIPRHAHPYEEIFELVDGDCEVWLDGQWNRLVAGVPVTAALDHVHGVRNQAADTAAIVKVVGTPGAVVEYGLRIKFLLSRDGYLPVPGKRPGHLLLNAVVLDRCGLYFPPLPRWLFKLLITPLAAIGRWRGREKFLLAEYPEYGRMLDALKAA
ncbi:cupin domain-containing protein [Nocardia sp. NPDC088792]|uniref:cupin domain-containing protein n=1 Tax=Nocardia sp. NPDC088792 TaxID=3364332 RepID=UPI00381A72A3